MKKIYVILIGVILFGVIIAFSIIFLKNFYFNKKLEMIQKNKNLTILPLDFKENTFMDSKFTCDGEDIFPRFEVKKIPSNVKYLSLIVQDPDAPGFRPFVHLLDVNIPVKKIIDTNTLKEGILGKNDFGNIGWNGPCPPINHGIHHYHFMFLGQDEKIDLSTGFSLNDFIENVDKNLGVDIVGLYERKG